MNQYKFTCHSCSFTEEKSSEKNSFTAAKEIGWGNVFDVSNGMTIVNFCPDCFNRMNKLAEEIKEIIKLDNFHFNSLLKK